MTQTVQQGPAARIRISAPPLGWSSWNTFGKEINETLIRQAAEAIVASGMKDAGYRYINLDDGGQLSTRDSQGNLQWDPNKFQNGMKALGDYLPSRGLLFGYTSAGVQTCLRYEGSHDYEEQDVRSGMAQRNIFHYSRAVLTDQSSAEPRQAFTEVWLMQIRLSPSPKQEWYREASSRNPLRFKEIVASCRDRGSPESAGTTMRQPKAARRASMNTAAWPSSAALILFIMAINQTMHIRQRS